MVELIYSPKWFFDKDIIIDIVSVFVLSLIAYFAMRFYKINKENKNYLVFAGSFMIMALSFLFKIITNFTLYHQVFMTRQVGFMIFTYSAFKSTDILFTFGFLIYRMLMLTGLFMLYSIYSGTKKTDIFLIIYLILISTYFSRSAYYVFHMTSLIFLVVITTQYWKNYRKIGHDSNRWLFYSFSSITLSQVIFIFIGLDIHIYVIAEIVQLVGYFALLVAFIKVFEDGKKKRKK